MCCCIIGNRQSATRSGDEAAYGVGELNQYTSRTVAAVAHVLGAADAPPVPTLAFRERRPSGLGRGRVPAEIDFVEHALEGDEPPGRTIADTLFRDGVDNRIEEPLAPCEVIEPSVVG